MRAGHGGRGGWAGEAAPPQVVAQVLPTIRADMVFERERLRDADFEHFALMREGGSLEDNARALAQTLDIPTELAQELAQLDYLFKD